jgi:LuxR family maltose regulon positive regulatory protein
VTTILEQDALTATKFNPPRLPRGWVPRPRLVAELEAGVRGPLTLLAAGAGAGKSALVSAWIAARDGSGPVGWLSLDPDDADRRRFWRGVLEALTRGGAPEPIASLAVHPSETVDLVIPALINALDELTEPIVLVLDDLHELGDTAAVADLDRLLRHPPQGLRIVIATRVDPQLRLARLRVAGELRELRDRDLTFTQAETVALLAANGVELSPESATRLWRRTEGWAAGLRLAALTLGGHPDPDGFVAHFAGDETTVADFLLAEVLAQQPPELRELLLQTSIADVVSGALADAITGRDDGEACLARLDREHALISALGPDRGWYRYHPLFAELLRSQLHYELPQTVPDLHRRAAIWHAGQQLPAEALKHAAAAADWDLVSSLASEHWVPLLVHGELGALGAALGRLPRERTAEDPDLALALSGVLLDAGDEARASALFGRATAARERVPEARRTRFDLATAIVMLMRGRLRGDLEAALAGARALLDVDLDPDPDPDPDRAMMGEYDLRALALTNVGIAELWTGDRAGAKRDLKAARRATELGGLHWLGLLCAVHLGVLAALDGRLESAVRLAGEAEALADRFRWTRTWPLGVAALIRSVVAFERNRPDDSAALLERAEELLAYTREAPLRVMVSLHRAQLHAAAGRPEPALDAIELARETLDAYPLEPGLRGLSRGLEALALAALGRQADAEAALRAGDPTAEEACALARMRLLAGDAQGARAAIAPHRDDGASALASTRTQIWILEALSDDAEADHVAAAAALERALDAAEPQGHLRPFASLAPDVVPLLRRQLRSGTAHRSLVGDLLHQLDRPHGNGRPRALLVESLSEREAAVLRFLPTMMSNQEIASELFVSVNTVKTHLKSIYRKLDVPDRRTAVRRARDLELLSP